MQSVDHDYTKHSDLQERVIVTRDNKTLYPQVTIFHVVQLSGIKIRPTTGGYIV